MLLVKMKDVTEANLQAAHQLSAFKVIAGTRDKPMIQVNAAADVRKFHHEGIYHMLELKLKKVAVAHRYQAALPFQLGPRLPTVLQGLLHAVSSRTSSSSTWTFVRG